MSAGVVQPSSDGVSRGTLTCGSTSERTASTSRPVKSRIARIRLASETGRLARLRWKAHALSSAAGGRPVEEPVDRHLKDLSDQCEPGLVERDDPTLGLRQHGLRDPGGVGERILRHTARNAHELQHRADVRYGVHRTKIAIPPTNMQEYFCKSCGRV